MYKTNRFHAAVRLFINRSQRTSKCGKSISDFIVFTTFDVICDLLLNRRTATWNLFVKLTHYYTFKSIFFFDNSTLTTEMSESEVTFLDPIVYKGGSNESILDMQTLPPDINICYLLAGRSVLGETVTERSRVPVLRPRAQFQLIRTDLGR